MIVYDGNDSDSWDGTGDNVCGGRVMRVGN